MNCEMCVYYVFNDDLEEYECLVDLDEDEMYKFLSAQHEGCPYFRLDDEYSIARKQ